MPTPTNQQLAAQIREVDKRGERRHKTVLNALSKFKIEVREQLAPFHDYLVGQAAIDKNEQSMNKKGAISLDPKIADLIKWLILIIGTIVGAKLTG